jgi:hypothetical protein
MTAILRADKSQHTYKRVCMDFANDPRLSWEARGVMAYLLSKSDDWRIIVADLINQTSAGRDKVYKILEELQGAGYLTRAQRRGDHGKMLPVEYALSELSPLPENTEAVNSPLPASPYTAPPLPANPTLPKEESTYSRVRPTVESVGADAPPPAPIVATPEPTTPPQQPARTNTRARSAPSPLPEVEQPRLVDAAMPDPVDVYRQVAGVRKPTQAQREAIRRHVTSHPEQWREACDYFARNGYNVRKVDNLIDRYQKAVAELVKLAAARKQAEDERRRREAEAEQPYATLEERRAIRDEMRRNWYNTAPAAPRPAMMARGRT